MREDDPAARITAPTFVELLSTIPGTPSLALCPLKPLPKLALVALIQAPVLRGQCCRELSPGARATCHRLVLPRQRASRRRLTGQYPQQNLPRCRDRPANKDVRG